jgi:hypothetical protein
MTFYTYISILKRKLNSHGSQTKVVQEVRLESRLAKQLATTRKPGETTRKPPKITNAGASWAENCLCGATANPATHRTSPRHRPPGERLAIRNRRQWVDAARSARQDDIFETLPHHSLDSKEIEACPIDQCAVTVQTDISSRLWLFIPSVVWRGVIPLVQRQLAMRTLEQVGELLLTMTQSSRRSHSH